MIMFGNVLFAQQKDSLQLHNSRFEFQYKKMYVPVGLMMTGVIAGGHGKNSWNNQVAAERNKNFSNFQNHADDYLQFAPFVAVYGFEFAGMKPKTDWKNRTAILIKGQIINLGLVLILKNTLKETRPDGTALSFPSGHTANAFAGATMLSIEYGKDYKWVPYAAYGVASTVGVLRIANNRHYLSDVLFGAGLGILSMKVAYWTHQYKWNATKSAHDPFAGNIY
ncbi:phosphatase PAP2 family protein [Kaistella sp. G5-32]|uniref:Phosphatase PAP2 family protein n=2 Tax=Kaistella gelatinilytica TaxID=2787636 RepID=A0ABS0FBC7_9FLAO|nr:phosphatase PAP2 family protein [Kaistella gelatinilytica]